MSASHAVTAAGIRILYWVLVPYLLYLSYVLFRLIQMVTPEHLTLSSGMFPVLVINSVLPLLFGSLALIMIIKRNPVGRLMFSVFALLEFAYLGGNLAENFPCVVAATEDMRKSAELALPADFLKGCLEFCASLLILAFIIFYLPYIWASASAERHFLFLRRRSASIG